MAELLRRLLAEYAATGLPPAYLPTEQPVVEKDSRAPSTHPHDTEPNQQDEHPKAKDAPEDRRS